MWSSFGNHYTWFNSMYSAFNFSYSCIQILEESKSIEDHAYPVSHFAITGFSPSVTLVTFAESYPMLLGWSCHRGLYAWSHRKGCSTPCSMRFLLLWPIHHNTERNIIIALAQISIMFSEALRITPTTRGGRRILTMGIQSYFIIWWGLWIVTLSVSY
jgi:hypothetical protein